MLLSSREDSAFAAIGIGASIDALQDAVNDELTLPTTTRMVTAFGGLTRCFERFLLSRHHDVDEAAVAFRATAAFRREHGMDGETPSIGPLTEVRERIGAVWPAAYCGFTVDHSPVLLARLGRLDVGALMEQATEDEFKQYYLSWMEQSLVLQVEGSQRAAAESGVPRGMVEVYDCAGLSVAALTPHLRLLKSVLSLGQAHYPENLRTALFINAPLGYASAWSLVSSVLSERTASKVEIRRDDGAERLQELLGSPEAVEAMHAANPAPPVTTWGEWALSYVTG